MATKSYVNGVDEREVSIAIEQFLIADYPQSWTPGRVDLTEGSLPSGFRHLGAVVEDSPTLRVSREKFTLKTGIPAVRQFETIVGLDGSLEVSLHSTSWRKLQIALGNLTAVSSSTLMSSILSVTSASVFTMSTSPTSPVTIGDQVVFSTAANVDAIDTNETILKSIVTADSTLTTWYVSPALTLIPSTNWNMYRYEEVRQFYGTATNREFTLLGVADFIDGTQIVHEFPRVQIAGDFERNIRPGENLRLPLSFNLFAVTRAVRGNDELILCQESYFPARKSP
jgi:hypothetical protein